MDFLARGKRWPDLRLRIAAAAAGLILAAAALAGEPFRAVGLAPGVYVFPGAIGQPATENGGRIGNQGLVVGANGAMLIGTGTSGADGEALIEAVKRLTGRPPLMAVNTHGAPDHVLGNGAFARRGIPVLAHRETDRFLVQNCDKCIANLKAMLGDAALGETRLSRPDRLIDSSTTIDLGGRSVRVLYLGWTQQPGAIAVFDPASGVLFAGSLVSLDRIPELQAADLEGWIRGVDELARLPLKTLVPGYGPVSPPGRLGELRAYLTELRADVERAYAGGQTITEATESLAARAWQNWALFEPNHRRNVHFMYLRAEARDLDRLEGRPGR